MKFSVKKGVVLACLWMGLAFFVSCSGGGGDDDGDQNINGVWRYMNVSRCNGYSYDYQPNEYLEVTDDRFRSYQCYGAVCYYCEADDLPGTGVMDTSNISVHEDIMTLTVNQHTTCPITMTLERADQSDIPNVLENCDVITDW